MKRTAFTLIELLVVVGIIALLAAILFPVFASAREKGRQTACLSNEKQLAYGVLMYAQDYDDTLVPTAIAYPPGSDDGTLWPVLLYPYTRSQAIRLCPDDAAAKDNSYGLNELLFADLTDPPGPTNQIRTLAALQTPSATVMLAELGTEDDLLTPRPDAYKSTSPSSVLNDDADARPSPRHTGRVNVTLMDGHAKSLRLDGFYTGQTPPDKWYAP